MLSAKQQSMLTLARAKSQGCDSRRLHRDQKQWEAESESLFAGVLVFESS